MESEQPPKGRGRGRGLRSTIQSDGQSVRNAVESLGSYSSGSTLNLAPSSVSGSIGTVSDMEIEVDRRTPFGAIGRGKSSDSGIGTSSMKRKFEDLADRPEKGNDIYLI